MSKGFWSTDFVNLFLDFLLSEILVARPRVIRVENKVLSPLSSYQVAWPFIPSLLFKFDYKIVKHERSKKKHELRPS